MRDERRLTVADILKQYAPWYVANHPRQAVPQVQSTLAKLSLCRTAALGGRTLRCESCDHRCVVYNSCGDRHCPQCRGARRAGWVESSQELLLPEIDYFQVVFTLPAEFSALALGNRRELYDLLFTTAWQALREVIGEACGFEAAALMVLHTWNQRLEHHPHVHALALGGGPSLRGDRWIKSRHPHHRRKQKPYLVDNRRLSARFRQLFIRGVARLHRQGVLRLEGSAATSSTSDPLMELLTQLASREWVVYIEPPPHERASAEEVGEQYPSLQLGEVYAVIGYYLCHQAEVDAYLEARARDADDVRQENERRFSPVGVRSRLVARRQGQG